MMSKEELKKLSSGDFDIIFREKIFTCEICNDTKNLIKIKKHNIRVCKKCLSVNHCNFCINKDKYKENGNPYCSECFKYSEWRGIDEKMS